MDEAMAQAVDIGENDVSKLALSAFKVFLYVIFLFLFLLLLGENNVS